MENKIVIKNVRLSYVTVEEPRTPQGSDTPRYSVSIIIPKDSLEEISKIKTAIEAAKAIAKERFGGKIPANIKTPLRDGDTERPDDPAYANSYFINANSKKKPEVVDKYKKPMEDLTQLYSGCYGHVSVVMYPYNTNGNKGIACGLSNIMKCADGEPLGSKSTAAADFADIEIDLDLDDVKEMLS